MGKRIIWRVPRETFVRYDELIEQLRMVNDETSDDHWALVDDIRSLPGFPHGYNWETDEIIIEIVSPPQATGALIH